MQTKVVEKDMNANVVRRDVKSVVLILALRNSKMTRKRSEKPNTRLENLPFSGSIPIPPNNREYMKKLITQIEKIIKRMRWKVLAFDGKLKSSDKNTYGFRTSGFRN